jgi:hypothetical protein
MCGHSSAEWRVKFSYSVYIITKNAMREQNLRGHTEAGLDC